MPSLQTAIALARSASARALALALGVALACGPREALAPLASNNPAAAADDLHGQVVLVASVDNPIWAADPLTVTSAAIRGDSLRIAVSYRGGCRRHALQLIAETTWMESYPVQVRARIAHNAGHDACEGLVRRTLVFDLVPLRDRYRAAYRTAAGRLALRLNDWTQPVEYSF